jgi:hypothetical protein
VQLLNNVATQDAYTAALTLEQDTADTVTYVVANASALARFRPIAHRGGADMPFGDEVLLTPTANAVHNVCGAQFRSAEVGKPARVIAILTGPIDPQIAAGTPFTQTLSASGGTSALSIGQKMAETEFTGTVNVPASTEATANQIVATAGVTYDGLTRVKIELFAPRTQVFGAVVTTFVLFEDGAAVGQMGVNKQNSGLDESDYYAVRYRTPTAGSHIYAVRAFQSAAASPANIIAGVGGAGQLVPGFIRVTVAD